MGGGSVTLCGATWPIPAHILAIPSPCLSCCIVAGQADAEGSKGAASCMVAGPASSMLAHLGLGQPMVLLTGVALGPGPVPGPASRNIGPAQYRLVALL